MATSYLLYLLAIACLIPSLVMVVWLVPLTAGLLYEYFEFTEEKRLLSWFGKEYHEYQKRTPSLLPRPTTLWQSLGKRG
jgi:protein-S-isoprenylcysteine O-methyltransferase Ste14